jgi:hypothetical protein
MTVFATLSRRFAILLALSLAALPLAAAADPALLQMVPPSSEVVAGLQIAQAKNSLFGQYVLAHLTVNDTKLVQFISQTGFDPRQDVSEIVIASNGKPNAPAANAPAPNAPGPNTSAPNASANQWLVLADGTFNVAKITAAAQANGGVPSVYQGVNLVTHAAGSSSQVATAIAFLNPTTALAGDITSVEAAIARKQSNAPTDSNVFSNSQQASASNDFWFVTLAPLSNFAGLIPDPNLSGALQGNLFASINQLSGGIRFGDAVTLSAVAVTRSDKDAQALVDVVKFLAGLVQMNKQNNPAAGEVATLLDSLQTSTSGDTATISLAIPEQTLEQLLKSAEPHQHQPHSGVGHIKRDALQIN